MFERYESVDDGTIQWYEWAGLKFGIERSVREIMDGWQMSISRIHFLNYAPSEISYLAERIENDTDLDTYVFMWMAHEGDHKHESAILHVSIDANADLRSRIVDWLNEGWAMGECYWEDEVAV